MKHVPCSTLLAAFVVLSAAIGGTAVQASLRDRMDGQLGRSNTWSARSSTGRTVSGTWTVVEDAATGTVKGTWTLHDANRKPVMRGGWSAAKSPKGWTGSWRAIATGGKSEYSGTWTADVDLGRDATFAALFRLAAEKVVSGGWRAGRQSGAWSIRVYEPYPFE